MKTPDRPAGSFIPTRPSLLLRVRNLEDQNSWRDFYDTYWKLIYKAAIQSGLPAADAEDVVQETFINVTKKIQNFNYDPQRGSFKGWLLRTTKWRILDHRRKHQRGLALEPLPDEPADGLMEKFADPISDKLEALWEEEWQQNRMDAAIQRVKRRVNAKHFQIFELYALKHRPAAKVAETLKVSTAQVNLINHRVGNLIKKEVERLEAEGL